MGVLDPPVEGRPPEYDGAVGAFTIRAEVDRGIAQVQAQCRKHLVVPRTAQVNPFPRFTDFFGKPLLKSSMNVFVLQADLPLAGLVANS